MFLTQSFNFIKYKSNYSTEFKLSTGPVLKKFSTENSKETK